MTDIVMNEQIEDIKLDNLPIDLEGPEPTEELLKSIQRYGIIYPVILCQNVDDLVIIDGRRRIKAARKLGQQTIKAITYIGLSPDDEATWALILNEQRSTNVITEYRYYCQLSKEDRWDELRKEHGFNQAHVHKILSLGKIKKLNTIIPAYEKGLVAESTLFEIAKLGDSRQKYVLDVLRTKGKLSLSDVKEAKKINKLEAIASMPKFEAVSQMPKLEETKPVYYAVTLNGDMIATLFESLDDAYEEKSKSINARLFRLIEV